MLLVNLLNTIALTFSLFTFTMFTIPSIANRSPVAGIIILSTFSKNTLSNSRLGVLSMTMYSYFFLIKSRNSGTFLTNCFEKFMFSMGIKSKYL